MLVKKIWTDCWIVTVAYLKKQPPEAFPKKVILKISQLLQENTCVGVSLK